MCYEMKNRERLDWCLLRAGHKFLGYSNATAPCRAEIIRQIAEKIGVPVPVTKREGYQLLREKFPNVVPQLPGSGKTKIRTIDRRGRVHFHRKKKRDKGTVCKASTSTSVRVQSDDFLASYEWRRLRMIVLTKRGAKCECCGASPTDGVTVINVDHIKPRRKFPELALTESNLQVLCGVCNHGKGNWDETDWRHDRRS